MRSAQLQLIAAPPVEELIAAYWRARDYDAMDKAADHIIAHPDCDAEVIARILTESGHTPENSSSNPTRRWSAEKLFLAMFEDPALTFNRAREVWKNGTFRFHLSGHEPSDSPIDALFHRLPVTEQMTLIEQRINKHGVERRYAYGHSLLQEMCYGLTVPDKSPAAHLKKILCLALASDFQDTQDDKSSFLQVLQLMKESLTS